MTAAHCIIDIDTCEPKKPDCPSCVNTDEVFGGLFDNSRLTEDEVTRRRVLITKTCGVSLKEETYFLTFAIINIETAITTI